MQISDKGVLLIERFEGIKLNAYQDIRGVWTIGCGTTIYPSGQRVKQGDVITRQQANEYLAHDVQTFVGVVNNNVKVSLNQNQFDALVSFVYNIGAGAFATSTLLKKLNAGDYQGAKSQFPSWSYAGGKYSQGLNNRRVAEQSLFGA